MRGLLATVLGLALLPVAAAPVGAEDPGGTAKAPARASARPKAPSALSDKEVRASMARGVAYLVAAQRPDGSWGSPASNLHDIYAPPPGSQRSFQVASAALAVSALIECGDARPEVQQAIQRGASYLLRRHLVRRIRADTLYNTWALAYALEAFARLLAHEKDAERKAAYANAAQQCVKALVRFEFVEGGWGYYNFNERTARPGTGSTSFSTATGLVALIMAKKQGIRVPKRLIQRGIKVIRLCERPDNSYYYGPNYIYYRVLPVNKIQGSLARTPACLVALEAAGSKVPEAKFVKSFDDLEKYGHFLRIARKYPIPHETWYQNSGYFCLYGYYYAALALDHVPGKHARVHAGHLARHVCGMQEKDGSFWDYQLFNFHKAYGTGYAVMVLARSLAARARVD